MLSRDKSPNSKKSVFDTSSNKNNILYGKDHLFEISLYKYLKLNEFDPHFYFSLKRKPTLALLKIYSLFVLCEIIPFIRLFLDMLILKFFLMSIRILNNRWSKLI